MNLLVDIGNTLSKVALAESGRVIECLRAERLSPEFLEEVLDRYPALSGAILCAVREYDPAVESLLRARVERTLRFGHRTPLPIANRYATPATLGLDRLAAAVGAYTIFPRRNVLIVDFGSAITIDFLNERGEYLGGNISPGAALRFRSLNRFTEQLPLCELPETETALLGDDTRSAIRSGVVNGIVFEIGKYIEALEKTADNLKVVFTGGDGKYFAEKLKNTIFVDPDLVFKGLNEVLEHNHNAESAQ